MRINKNGKSMMIVIVIAAVLIGALGAGMAVMKMKGSGGKKTEEKKPVNMVSLGDFVVNLADTNEVRYVKTNIVLGVQGEIKTEGSAPAKEGSDSGSSSEGNPVVRDAVIQALGKRTFEDLNKPNGKEDLKKDIITAVNKRIGDAKVVDVYFDDFAMQ